MTTVYAIFLVAFGILLCASVGFACDAVGLISISEDGSDSDGEWAWAVMTGFFVIGTMANAVVMIRGVVV